MKQVVALGLVLGLSLVGAYVSWFEPKEDVAAKGEAVEVYPASAGDVSRIAWESEKLSVVAERRTDGKGEYTWLNTTERKTKKVTPPKVPETPSPDPAVPPVTPDADPAVAPDADPALAPDAPGDAPGPAAEAPPEDVEIKKLEFNGNDTATKLWEQFSPLMALRELVPGPEIDTKVFGFETPEGTLTVTRKGGEVTVIVGGEAYGSKDRYIKVGERIFLVDDNTLRPLQFANMRLLERGLQPLVEEKIETVEIRTAAQGALTLTQVNRDDRAKAFWARSTAAETEDTSAGLWLGKVLRLRGSEYVFGDAPADLTPVFTWTVTGDGKTWVIEMLTATAEDKIDWYARSDYDRALLKLTRSLAGDVGADLESVLAGTAQIAPSEDDAPEDIAPAPGSEPAKPPHPLPSAP